MIDPGFLYCVFRLSYYGVFVGLHVALMLGNFLEWLRERKTLKTAFKNIPENLPGVSVIVPFHNESRRIEGLLKSLETQDYPNAEFIFVDDRSQDNSPDMVKEFIQKKGQKAGMISLRENPGPNNKQYALARGIAASSEKFLLFTDADCEMSPLWIRGMVLRMADEKTGAVIGPVLKQYRGGKGFFHLYQCYEHGVRYIYLAGAIGLGAAGGGFGNNLILRRETLDAVGGYGQVPSSPTEDAALVSRIRSCSDYKIRAALGPDVHVITQGERGWKALISQTLRWNNGGLFSPDPATRFNYNFLMITIAMGVLTIPLLPFVPSIWPLPAGVLTVMIFNTIANLGLFAVSLPRRNAAYALALLFTPMFFTFLTILGYFGVKPEWKGKKFRQNGGERPG